MKWEVGHHIFPFWLGVSSTKGFELSLGVECRCHRDQTVLKHFLYGPGLRTIEEDWLNTGFKELPFKGRRNLRVPDLLELIAGCPSHTLSDVEVFLLSAI